jgi:hypothetical protein
MQMGDDQMTDTDEVEAAAAGARAEDMGTVPARCRHERKPGRVKHLRSVPMKQISLCPVLHS